MSPHTETNMVVMRAKLIQRNSRVTVNSFRGMYLTQTGPVIVLPQEFGIGIRDSSLVLLLFEMEKMWTRGLVAVVFPVCTHEYHKQVSSQQGIEGSRWMKKQRQRIDRESLWYLGVVPVVFETHLHSSPWNLGNTWFFFLSSSSPFPSAILTWAPATCREKILRVF